MVGYLPRKPGDAPRCAWFVPVGVACGIGTLAKGPVAVVLPSMVVFLFLMWQQQLRLLFDRRLLLGALTFAWVALPWYAMVTIETRGAFAKGFFLSNNFNRFMAPMENHHGPIWYHPLVLLAGFAPWSIFLLPTIWYGVRGCRKAAPAEQILKIRDVRRPAAARFLICWCAVYLAFFSISATKLPNYTLPIYPALAILTADFLTRWWKRKIALPNWVMAYCAAWLIIIGVGTTTGFALASGRITIRGLSFPKFPLLADSIWLGAIPIFGGVAMATFALRQRRRWALVAFSACTVAFVAGIFGLATQAVDAAKAPGCLSHPPEHCGATATFAWRAISIRSRAWSSTTSAKCARSQINSN